MELKRTNEKYLLESFNEACKNNNFVKLVNKLKISKNEAYKITSKLEDTVNELENCKDCKGLSFCKNAYKGHVKMPDKNNGKIYFTYKPCKYLKKMEKERLEKEELAMQNEKARMKDIDVSDKKRVKVIKWLDNFYENFDFKKPLKGLYLYGNFGSGKTFLVSALLHELEEKKNVTTEIVYFPELLRTLKNDWELYETKMNILENVDILCLDDIGAEKVSDWGRDEVLGTILQTRMTHNRITFFTSNLGIKELESHFKMNNTVDEGLKARRIMERIMQQATVLELVSENRRG